jgi:F-box and WD-40 domain protein 1/11
MSPRENHTATSTRRRPSLSFRSHPRTTGHPAPASKDCAFDIWQEPYSTEACQDDHAPVVEEMDPFPNAVPRRRGAKSFSNLKHPVDGLVALGRRLSVSLRQKSSKQNISVAENTHLVDDEDRQYHHVPSQSKHKRMASGNWDARSTKVHWHQGYSVNRRPSLNSVSALQGFYAPTASIPAPIPGRGQAPPVLPNHVTFGAAARAAAAAQNEQMEVARMAKVERESSKILDMRVPQDSESGIGIDLRDRSEISDAELLGLIRLGRQ